MLRWFHPSHDTIENINNDQQYTNKVECMSCNYKMTNDEVNKVRNACTASMNRREKARHTLENNFTSNLKRTKPYYYPKARKYVINNNEILTIFLRNKIDFIYSNKNEQEREEIFNTCFNGFMAALNDNKLPYRTGIKENKLTNGIRSFQEIVIDVPKNENNVFYIDHHQLHGFRVTDNFLQSCNIIDENRIQRPFEVFTIKIDDVITGEIYTEVKYDPRPKAKMNLFTKVNDDKKKYYKYWTFRGSFRTFHEAIRFLTGLLNNDIDNLVGFVENRN